MQEQFNLLSHLKFEFFGLVNPIDQVKHGSQGSDYKNQQWLYLLHTYLRPILQFQFSEFGLRLHIQWLLSLYYWPDFIIMAVILVL